MKANVNQFEKKFHYLSEKITLPSASSSSGGYDDNKPEIENLKTRQGKKNIYSNRYVDTSQRLRGYFHLMKQWSGSVFKLIWHDLLVFLTAYSVLAILYRYVLFENHSFSKELFEAICIYCSRLAKICNFFIASKKVAELTMC